MESASASPEGVAVSLYWLPLGAGGRSVRLNGRVYEAVAARLTRREPRDLYHSALELRLGSERYVIEMAPVWDEREPARGVVGEGSVGLRWAGRLRLFRYEIRCWRGGRIPDAGEAVESPLTVSADPAVAARIIALVPSVPLAVWGRDELGTGEMWNSNSLIAWLLTRAGIDTAAIHPPRGGRAPGWGAGLADAERHHVTDGERAMSVRCGRVRGPRTSA